MSAWWKRKLVLFMNVHALMKSNIAIKITIATYCPLNNFTVVVRMKKCYTEKHSYGELRLLFFLNIKILVYVCLREKKNKVKLLSTAIFWNNLCMSMLQKECIVAEELPYCKKYCLNIMCMYKPNETFAIRKVIYCMDRNSSFENFA